MAAAHVEHIGHKHKCTAWTCCAQLRKYVAARWCCCRGVRSSLDSSTVIFWIRNVAHAIGKTCTLDNHYLRAVLRAVAVLRDVITRIFGLFLGVQTQVAVSYFATSFVELWTSVSGKRRFAFRLELVRFQVWFCQTVWHGCVELSKIVRWRLLMQIYVPVTELERCNNISIDNGATNKIVISVQYLQHFAMSTAFWLVLLVTWCHPHRKVGLRSDSILPLLTRDCAGTVRIRGLARFFGKC